MNGVLTGGHETYMTVKKNVFSHLPLHYDDCEVNITIDSYGYNAPYFVWDINIDK